MENSLTVVSFDPKNDYECRNLSYITIEGLDFQRLSSKTSFYRSDFRGTRFEADIFEKNNFDLADFISNTFKNVEFHRVNFGNSEFKNCVFRNCLFEENIYDDISMHGCTFSGCTFRGEKFRMTMLNCNFIQCNFIGCVFDQCTTDTLSFDSSVFLKCELSTMHAENFKFVGCSFRDVFLGTCFLGTYLFRQTDLNLISFKYRGELVDINGNDFFLDFEKKLFQERRYFELFNLCILFHRENSIKLVNGFKQMIADVLNEPNPNVREYNLDGIFDVIEFYLGSESLPLLHALRYIDILREYSISDIPSENRLSYLQHMYRIDTIISSLDYPTEYILGVPETTPCTATIHCRDDSVCTAEDSIHALFDYVNRRYLENLFEPPYFKTLSHEKGSVIVTISSSLLLALMTAKVIRGISKSLCEVRLEGAKTKKAIELIQASSTPAAFNKIVSALPQKELETEEAEKIFGKLGNGYILDYIIHYFLR